ncbi:MAG: hypothetical protein MHM6MM_001611 [Cercozoa sp. M6MM]
MSSFWSNLIEEIAAVIEGEPDAIANLSNVAALLFHALKERSEKGVNWAGFYRVVGEELVLSPFQGKVACIRLRKEKGVCGAAWANQKTYRVDDVHAFPGHIACDSASRSELVTPVIVGDSVVAVIDIDAPVEAAFSVEDERGVEALAALLAEHIQWTQLPSQ